MNGGSGRREARAEKKAGRGSDPVRLAAFGVLLRTATGRRSIEGPLRAIAPSFEELDRRFLWSLVQETVRWQARLDAVIAPLLHRPLRSLDPSVRVLLRLAACQSCVLNQVPPHALVDEGVRLAHRFAPPGSDRLVNAVSRRLAADGPARWQQIDLDPRPENWPTVHSHPGWIVRRWRQRWGDERTLEMLRWNNERPPVWLRIRPGSDLPRDGEPGWLPRTVRMPEGYRPGEDPLFASGERTAQDPAETLVGHLAPATPEGVILDSCAAPGTKTSHLAERFPGAAIVGMDRSRIRIQRLRQTLARTGASAIAVLGDAAAPPFAVGSAGGVLVDAPCSALGVLRRRVDARWNVLEHDLTRHQRQQQRLLHEASRLIRPGGWLLFSVCSFELEETEAVRTSFLDRHRHFRPSPFPLELPAGIQVDEGTLRILPGQLDCDGVYACLFTCKDNPS